MKARSGDYESVLTIGPTRTHEQEWDSDAWFYDEVAREEAGLNEEYEEYEEFHDYAFADFHKRTAK
jgi:hypothetical protein